MKLMRPRFRPAFESLEDRRVLSNYYVAPTGSDSNPGTPAAPWLTLQHAANQVQAGDYVDVQAGNYTGFVVGWDSPKAGTASQPITFHAEPGVLINRPNYATPDGIDLEGDSYFVIEGFSVVGMPRMGIRATGGQHVTIRNNKVDKSNNFGIYVSHTDDALVEGNTSSNTVLQHGFYIANSGDRPVIRNNTAFNNGDAGIQLNGDASAGGDGIISGAVISGNVLYNNGLATGGSAINLDGVQGATIQNNLLYDNHSSGISLFRVDGGGPSSNNLIVNNTIAMASDARWAININTGATGNTVLNNILYDANPAAGSISIDASSLPGFTSDYNAVVDRFSTNWGDTVITLAQWRAATGQDAHSFVATPDQLFVNPASYDYHLKAGSPAIDTGTSTSAPPTDLDGNPRPSGAAVDVGAYEYQQQPAAVTAASVAWGPSGVAPLATAADGVRLLPAGRQTSLPWFGVDRLVVTLSRPALLSPSDVTVHGLTVADYGPVTVSGSGTSYTITLARPVDAADRVTVAIAGDGLSSYTRRLDVLPGDVDDDGSVTNRDVLLERNMVLGLAPPTVFGDMNGDGVVGMVDYNLVRKRVNTRLP